MTTNEAWFNDRKDNVVIWNLDTEIFWLLVIESKKWKKFKEKLIRGKFE